MSDTKLLEPSVTDAIRAVEAAKSLPASKRTHWSCSLRQMCAYLNRPAETVPARWTALKVQVRLLHAARVGANPKTLANHKSNARSALMWFGEESGLPQQGVPLSPAWAALKAKVPDEYRRQKLSGLMRYCSAKAVAPEMVNEDHVDAYMRYRADTTALAANSAARRVIAKAWNSCGEEIESWPRPRLIEPIPKPLTTVPWESFPEQLREEIERYLAGLKKIRRRANGKRIRPCKDVTIDTRRRELQAFARMAVRKGHQVETLTSLSVLLKPDRVEEVLNAFWDESPNREPQVWTIDLAWKLLSVARETKSLSQADLDRLDEIRAAMEEHRKSGLTEKNLNVIRAILADGVWDEVVQLPQVLMTEARLDRHQSLVKAAVTAQLAVAISIETFAPVRLGNLSKIRLDENLIKPAGLGGPYWLVFPHYDVKNRVQLQFQLPPEAGEIIDEYVNDYRPALLRGSNEPWLFPGSAGGGKRAQVLGLQIKRRIEKVTGLRMTVHQFRHAAAAIFLRVRKGEYELVRQLLGHRNIQTTRNFYVGLDMIQANELFNDIVKDRLRSKLEAAE